MKAIDHRKTRKWIKVAKVLFLIIIVLFVILSLIYGDSSLAAGDDQAFTKTIVGFYGTVAGLVGLLAIIMIVVGGIVYSTSEGNPDRIKTAKEMVIAAVMGIILFAFANWLLGVNGISKYFPPILLGPLVSDDGSDQEDKDNKGSSQGQNGDDPSPGGDLPPPPPEYKPPYTPPERPYTPPGSPDFQP